MDSCKKSVTIGDEDYYENVMTESLYQDILKCDGIKVNGGEKRTIDFDKLPSLISLEECLDLDDDLMKRILVGVSNKLLSLNYIKQEDNVIIHSQLISSVKYDFNNRIIILMY